MKAFYCSYKLFILNYLFGVKSLEPIARRKTTKEIVYDQLKRSILSGELDPNQMMTETSLAESLHISRTPVREAVGDLTKEGLLIHIPRKGFKVRRIDEDDMEQILYLRISIEMRSVKMLIDHITDEELKKLDALIDEQQIAIQNNDRIRYIELDQILHRHLLKLSNQNILEQILQELYNLTRLIGHAAISKEGRMEEVIQEHREIVNALRERDEEKAADLMRHHLLTTASSVKKQREQMKNNKEKSDSLGGL